MKFHLSQVYQALATCSACPIGAKHQYGTLICNHDEKEIEFLNKEYNCPLGKWKSKLTETNTNIYKTTERRPRQRGVWNSVKSFWKEAEEWVEKGKQLGAALVSGIADAETIAKRQLSCFGTLETKPCENLVVGQDGYKYCGACGCGEWALARLDGSPAKLQWKNLPCPLSRPGFSNEGSDVPS